MCIILANKYDGENAGRQNGNRIHRAGTASPFWLDRFVMSPSPQLGKSGWSGVGNRRWADRLPPGLRIETADSVIRTVTDRPTRIELRMQSSNGQRSGHVTRCFRSASRPGNGACTRATRAIGRSRIHKASEPGDFEARRGHFTEAVRKIVPGREPQSMAHRCTRLEIVAWERRGRRLNLVVPQDSPGAPPESRDVNCSRRRSNNASIRVFNSRWSVRRLPDESSAPTAEASRLGGTHHASYLVSMNMSKRQALSYDVSSVGYAPQAGGLHRRQSLSTERIA